VNPDQDAVVQRLEAERLRPVPPDGAPRLPLTDELFTRVLDLISAECRRKGYLPKGTP
jgi:hypothetical protein